MARLVPTDINDKNRARAKGWLAEDDPFFKTMERIVQSRSKHTSRLFKEVEVGWVEERHEVKPALNPTIMIAQNCVLIV